MVLLFMALIELDFAGQLISADHHEHSLEQAPVRNVVQ